MLEFHPHLAMVTSVPDAIQKAYREMVHVYPPHTTSEEIELEIYLLEMCQEKWTPKRSLGEGYVVVYICLILLHSFLKASRPP